MAWENGFFNSVNGDRVYNAETMNGIFEGLITDGVYEAVGNKLAVQPNSGMTIQVATGRGFFKKHWVNNTAPYLLTLADSDVTLNRYAAIIVKVDETESVRSATLAIKYGEYATTPVKPSMSRTDTINEYCLAYVYIRAGATAISAADIEDARANQSVCGWVTGLIDQIDSNTLFTQFTAIFNEWFSGLQDDLNPNTEAMLVAALPKSVTVTLNNSDWTEVGNVYTQTATVVGMNTTKSVIIQPNSSTVDAYSAAGVKATAQGTNSITFTADSLPTTNVTVDVLHMGQ